jgi:hypothetical protein
MRIANTNEKIFVTVIASPKGAAISSLLGIDFVVPRFASRLSGIAMTCYLCLLY